MKIRRNLALIICFFMILSMVASCGDNASKESDMEEAPEKPEESTGLENEEEEDYIDDNINAAFINSEPPPLGDYLQDAPPKIGTPGVDFPEPEIGEPEDWEDVPVPYINPLGSKNIYERVEYDSTTRYTEMIYIDGISKITRRVYGKTWELRCSNDNNLTPGYFKWYADSIGATLYDNTDDRVTFSFEEGNNIWWATAHWRDLEDAYTNIYVIKQELLEIGKTITVEPEDLIDGRYYFHTKSNPGDFLTAFIDIKGNQDSKANVYAFQHIETGFLTRRFDYNKQVISKTGRYALNDIPQTGDTLSWTISFDSGKYTPDSLSFKLEKTGEIHPVDINDKMGAVRVVNNPGTVKISLQSALNVLEHKEGFNYTGMSDGEGGTIFNLPAGYYNIHAHLPGGGYGGVRMIPVSGGKLTEVAIPDEFKGAYSALENIYGEIETEAGSISILENKDEGDTAVVSIEVKDPLKRDIFPDKKDITITEGGEEAEIIDVVREPALSNIVLVIDTSGSMEEAMIATVDAAKKFVEGLADGTNIRLISFAQEIKKHSGSDKASVLTALDTLYAEGGTALYDATNKGLEMLEGMDKAYLVVFSDGADSRELQNMGKGSDINRNEIIGKIKESNATVLTIGFGEGHDPETLDAMSSVSNEGAYFSAKDESMLDSVFSTVAGKFGNQFTIKYNRPSQSVDVKSEKPLVSLMIDDSGSMSEYRDSVATMFHDFFSSLPEKSLIQFSKFGDSVDMMHITTDRKTVLMQAMSEEGNTGGGTEILDSLATALEQLKPLPTNKKVFIFLTDAAMKEVQRNPQVEKLFSQFKDEGIRCLFVGVADGYEAEDSFKIAAELTEGEYIITEDIKEVEKKLDELRKKVSIPLIEEELLPFTIGIKAKTDDGSIMDYYEAKKLSEFTPKKVTKEIQELKTTRITTDKKMVPLYSRKTAEILSGSSQQGSSDLKVTKHISYEDITDEDKDNNYTSTETGRESYNKKMKNKFIEITVKDAYTLDVFKGLESDRYKQFIALNIDIEFFDEKAEEEAYLIPTFVNHFYLSLNSKEMVPASKVTWLAEKPIAKPGELSISIDKGDKESGVLVFHTQKPESITQLGLHFYDIEHGHIQIPLTGKIGEYITQIDQLPKTQPVQLSDMFSMEVTGFSDKEKYEGKDISERYYDRSDDTILRTVEAKFNSKMQALMNFDPNERFYYGIETEEGPLLTKMSNHIHKIPFGFTGKKMLAPGSANLVHMTYELPEVLSDVKSFIYGDVAEEDVLIDVSNGSPYKTNSEDINFSHEYFDIKVNSLAPNPFNDSYVILDITVEDKKDGYGTSGVERVFALENIKATDDRNKYLEPYNSKNYLYKIDSDWAVFDGYSRRGIIEFYTGGSNDDYLLRSPYFEEMKIEVDKEYYSSPELLALSFPIEIDEEFDRKMNKFVSAAVSKYKASKLNTQKPVQTVNLANKENSGYDVAVPSLTSYGSSVLNYIEVEEDFYKLMYSLKWVPALRNEYFYAPEAVVTQGWGTQLDIGNLGVELLSKLGYKVKIRWVNLTSKGKEALIYLGKPENIRIDYLPSLSYINSDGQEKNFVIPFMRDAEELYGLIYLTGESRWDEFEEAYVNLEISAKVEGSPGVLNSAQSSMFDVFSSLSSEEEKIEEKEVVDVPLLNKTLSIPKLSLGPMDIGYVSVGKSENGGDLFKVVLDTTEGLIQGDNVIDTSAGKILSVSVEMDYSGMPTDEYIHTTILEEGESLADVCHTLAFNLPEMSSRAEENLEALNKKIAQNAGEDVSNSSKVRWYNRTAIYRYIVGRTTYDKEVEKELGLVINRVSQPSAVMMTAKSDGNNALASMDLMYHKNQILQGEEESIHAYNLFSGLFASYLEGSLMADGKGIGLQDVWKSLEPDTGFYLISNTEESKTEALNSMDEIFPPVLMERIQSSLDEGSNILYIVPKEPGKAFGEKRWAWLEINSYDYDAISVFDTGQRSGMASYIIGQAPKNIADGTVGFFIGVNCAAWSISGYSLELSDYGEIKKASAQLCKDILAQLERILSLAGSSGAGDYIESEAKGKIKVGDVSLGDVESIVKGEPDIPGGFVDGFKLAVERYFGMEMTE